MDKVKLAEWGEKLKTGGAQMGRMVSGKMKEILQSPTVESRLVDEATLETLDEPNWGLNMRICAMINTQEFNGTEVVKAIKKKICGKSVSSQRLSLDLLEACAMNCEKVFSEVASEKVLEEMVKMITNPQTHPDNRARALQLIRAWGQSKDLAYLPVFSQTYLSLKGVEDVNPTQYSLHVPPPERYPVPEHDLHDENDESILAYSFGDLSIEEKKNSIVLARNSLDLLSSILNTDADPKPIKDDLTVSMVEKCKESQPIIQMIIESTTEDEGLLFEALNLNDELQRVISKYEELDAATTTMADTQIPPETKADASPKHESQEPNVDAFPKNESTSTKESGEPNKVKKVEEHALKL